MKRKQLATLVLGGMITSLHSEDFIDAGKQLHNFTNLYDFGAPVKPRKIKHAPESATASETNVTTSGDATPAQESRINKTEETAMKRSAKQELNITCGAKCGIPYFPEDNTTRP